MLSMYGAWSPSMHWAYHHRPLQKDTDSWCSVLQNWPRFPSCSFSQELKDLDQSLKIREDGQRLSDDVGLNQVDALMRLLRFRNQSKQNMPVSCDAVWIRHLFSYIFWQWSKRLYFLGRSIDTFENRQHCNMFCLMARLSVGGARPLWPACRWGGLSGEFWTFQTPKSKVTNSGMYSKWIHLIVPGSVESAVSGTFYFMFEH